MPEKMEKKLKEQAKARGLPEGKYVYGTMRKLGWKPTGEKVNKSYRDPAKSIRSKVLKRRLARNK